MSRSTGRLKSLLTRSGSSKQLFAVLFSVLMVTSMAAAPVAAAGSATDTRQESLSAGSLDSAFQQMNDISIQHAERTEGTVGEEIEGEGEFTSETLRIESATQNEFEISSDELFIINNEDNGASASISLEDQFGTLNVSEIVFDGIYTGSGEIRNQPYVNAYTGDDTSERINVSITGSQVDTSPSDVFSVGAHSYSIRAETLGASITEPRLIGIGFAGSIDEYNIDEGTNQINVSILRDSKVNDSWYAEFTIGGERASLANKEVRQEVPHSASDEFFNFTVDVSDLSNGTYSSTLDFYEENQSVDSRTASDRIVSIWDRDNVEVGDAAQAGDDNDDEPVASSPYNADNVSVWDRSPLPLRVETATAATQIDNPTLLYSVTGEVSQANLNKPTTGVFNAGENINFDFSERTLATTSDYNGQSAQFVTARIEESPESTSEAIDIATLQSPTAEEYTVEDVGTIDSGSLDINRSFDQSGHYLTYVVVVEEGEGLETTADGELTLNGSVEVVGTDAVAVQSNAATLSAPAEVQRGENITVDVSSGLSADAQNHLLIAYNATKFTEQEVTFISDTDDFNNLSEDDLRINHTLESVNGVGRFDADVSVLGLSANTSGTVEGVISTESIFAELTNQTSIDELENNSVGDNVLDASATSTATLDDGSISVETLPGWETGDYGLIYVAQEDGEVSNFSTTTDTVALTDEELEAALTAQPDNPDVNVTEVAFDASGTQGTVATYYWDFDGDGTVDRTTSDATTNYTYTELGEYPASVTTQNGDNENSTATTTVTVDDSVPPTAALDITLGGTSVAGGEIGIDTRFTVNASGTTDNHRLGTPYSWEITNSSGVVVTRDTLEETTSFRLSETGNYTVEVTVVDETGNQNSTTANIAVVDESILDAEINADDEQRLQDGLNATVDVSNVGSSDTSGGFDWTLTATGDRFSDGAERNLTISGSESDLTTGSTTEITGFDNALTTWAQDNRTVGDVSLTFEVSADGRVSNDSTTVDVTYSNLEADASARDTAEGVDVDLRSFITNNGTAASDDSTATVTVDNAADTEVYNETIAVSSLDAGETLRDRATDSFSTTGTHTLEVTVEDDLFGEANTASTEFEVYAYSLDIQETTVPSEVESGDEFIAQLTYQTNASAPVNATLNVSSTTGIDHIGSQTDTKQRSPTAGVNDTVTWRLNSTRYIEDGYNLNFTVESAAEGLDESSSRDVSIASEPRSEIRTTSTSAVLRSEGSSSVENQIQLYGNDSTLSQSLNVSLQGGSDGRTLQGVEYLVRYPYGCVEQTTSAFLGALSTDQYYRDRPEYDIDNTQQEEINTSIEDGVARLGSNGERSQTEDGGWNMWGQPGDGETFYTMYALYGLSEVENDGIYGPKNDAGLDDTDFDQAVTWMKEDAQRANGAFRGDDPGYYIGDDAGATGFALVSLASANETAPDRITSATQDNVTQIYANASSYLLGAQDDEGHWNNGNQRSTALAVWGLSQAYDAGIYENENVEYSQSEMQDAIENGALWLADQRDEDGSWARYQSNAWWTSIGDESETTAYAVLALNETNSTVVANESFEFATENGTEFLTTTYESGGSWGYTRASSAAIKALTEMSSPADRTVNVSFTNSSGGEVTVDTNVELNSNNPINDYTLGQQEREDVQELLGGAENGTVNVTIEDSTGSSNSGVVIAGVENRQEVNLDELEGNQ